MEQLNFLSKYSNLDKFQLEAFEIINNFTHKTTPDLDNNANTEQIQTNTKLNTNILITAHTGSGKSLVAEYGIYKTVITDKKKVIYTSPIKSLSNQKFYDFNEKFTQYGISVGIITGDIKFAPQADCLIMTTEILLNQLLKYLTRKNKVVSELRENSNTNPNNESDFTSLINPTDVDFDNVGCIVFDEVHYINDTDRGNIWEQSIMYIPKHIQLIMLSATLSDPNKFSRWIENVQEKPTKLISTTHRVVPLHFNIYYSVQNGLIKKMPKEKKAIFRFNELIQISDTINKRFDDLTYQKIVKLHEYLLTNMNARFYPTSVINDMLRRFHSQSELNPEQNMFPLLFFVLNKRKCADYAQAVNVVFNSRKEQYEVEQFIDSKVRELGLQYLETIEQYHMLKQLAIKGIGVHHSGLLPVLKEIIEILYEKKLIKVLFATETFAVGLNMPTKTVVFSDLSKYSTEEGHRLLHSHEFIQMAGRAGRRNIDTKGYIIFLPQLFKITLNTNEFTSMMLGSGQKIISKLKVDELLVLRVLRTNKKKHITIDDIIGQVQTSMMAESNMAQSHAQLAKLNQAKSKLDSIQISDTDKANIAFIESLTTKASPFMKRNKKQELELKKLMSDQVLMNKIKIIEQYNKELNILRALEGILYTEVDIMLQKLKKHNFIENCDINELNKAKDLTEENLNLDLMNQKQLDLFKLTNRGIIGSLIMDNNPIPIVDIITKPFFALLDPINILTLLSVLTCDDHIKEPLDVNMFIEQYCDQQSTKTNNYMWINEIIQLIHQYELNSPELVERFNFDYVWVLDEFLRTSVYPLNKTDDNYLFEGNFVRLCNRLANLLNEIQNICEDTKNHDLLTKINECSTLLHKDWLRPDSIYLQTHGLNI
jgi:superfamily II RNA helicase